MTAQKKNGFTKKEGYVVFLALIAGIVVGMYGLIDQPILFSSFALCFTIFLLMYNRTLCKSCDKICPFNPNMKFWKNK